MRVYPPVSPSVGNAFFFQIADFEWKGHINDRISIVVKMCNITCALTIEKKRKEKFNNKVLVNIVPALYLLNYVQKLSHREISNNGGTTSTNNVDDTNP